LPDAPTPTDAVLAADDLSSPSMDFSSNDLDQQTSPGGTPAAGTQESHQSRPRQTPIRRPGWTGTPACSRSTSGSA
jgi:hypothetical protein